jgi:chromosome segregation ATPase
MNMNDAVSARNREIVYRAADKYYEKHGEIPKQVHILALCTGMSKQTEKKYRKEWLAERGLAVVEDNLNDLSPGLRKAIDDEIREKKANAHKEIHDKLADLEAENEALLAENEHTRDQLAISKNDVATLREQNSHLFGQIQILNSLVEKHENSLREVKIQLDAVHEQSQKQIDGYRQAEREAAEKERIAREELSELKNSQILIQSERPLAEILDKALAREKWFSDQMEKVWGQPGKRMVLEQSSNKRS